MDTESNKISLADSWIEKGYGYTDDASDVYSDGTYLAAKRPGMAQAGAAAATAGMIYDLLKVRLAFGTTKGLDVLMGIYRGASNEARVETWNPNSSFAKASLADGGGAQADTNAVCRLIQAGATNVFMTSVSTGAAWKRAFAASASAYQVGSWARWTGLLNAAIGMWHKQHLWLLCPSSLNFGYEVDKAWHSPFNNPYGPNGIDDNFLVDLTSANGLMGARSAGEVAYLGKSSSIYRLTGSNAETWRIEKLSNAYGFVGMRSMDPLSPGVLVGFVTEGEFASTTGMEAPLPTNVAILSPDGVKVIGDRVLTSIRVSADALTQTRVKAWPQLRGVAMIPDIVEAASTATSMLFMSTDSFGFWKWSLAASVQADSLEYAERVMYAGCGDGLIRSFDATASQDNSTNIGAYWATPPISFGKKFAIDKVEMYVSQTSGSTWSIQVATDLGSYGTAQTAVSKGGSSSIGTSPAMRQVTFGSAAATGDIQQVKITMPTNGVGCKLWRVVLYLKEIG